VARLKTLPCKEPQQRGSKRKIAISESEDSEDERRDSQFIVAEKELGR
jgi:hypothetical protein